MRRVRIYSTLSSYTTTLAYTPRECSPAIYSEQPQLRRPYHYGSRSNYKNYRRTHARDPPLCHRE